MHSHPRWPAPLTNFLAGCSFFAQQQAEVEVPRGPRVLVGQRHSQLVLPAAVQQVVEQGGAVGQEAVGEEAPGGHHPDADRQRLLVGQRGGQAQLDRLVPHLGQAPGRGGGSLAPAGAAVAQASRPQDGLTGLTPRTLATSVRTTWPPSSTST